MKAPTLSPYKRAKMRALMEESEPVTRADFAKAIPKLTEFVTRACEVALTRVNDAKTAMEKALVLLERQVDKRFAAAETSLEKELSTVKAHTIALFDQIRSELPKETDLSGIEARLLLADRLRFRMEQRIADVEALKELLTADNLRNMLELLEGNDRLDASAINGLEELTVRLIAEHAPKGTYEGPLGPTGRDLFLDIDLSAQLDGSTKTFNIPAVWNILSVHLSSFPHALRKNVDFTYTPTTVTFTSEIDAATALAAGQTCVLTVVSA